MAVKKKFYRAALMRNPETTQSFRFGSIAADTERRKSSTRTSTTLVSSAEVLRLMFRSRRSLSRRSSHARHRNVSVCVNAPDLLDPLAPGARVEGADVLVMQDLRGETLRPLLLSHTPANGSSGRIQEYRGLANGSLESAHPYAIGGGGGASQFL